MFASALKDPRLEGRRVRIEGHTDSVGSDDSNRDLSQRRARTVADVLIAAGVDSSRLDVAGYGAAQPLPGLPPRPPPSVAWSSRLVPRSRLAITASTFRLRPRAMPSEQSAGGPRRPNAARALCEERLT